MSFEIILILSPSNELKMCLFHKHFLIIFISSESLAGVSRLAAFRRTLFLAICCLRSSFPLCSTLPATRWFVSQWRKESRQTRREKKSRSVLCRSPSSAPAVIFIFLLWIREKKQRSVSPVQTPLHSSSILSHPFHSRFFLKKFSCFLKVCLLMRTWVKSQVNL